MSKPIRTAHPMVITAGAGSVTLGDALPKSGKTVIEVHNQTFDARAFVVLTPDQARAIAAELQRRADLADGGHAS